LEDKVINDRIRWHENALRMNDGGIPNKVLYMKLKGVPKK
jgi:hypothetical protein